MRTSTGKRGETEEQHKSRKPFSGANKKLWSNCWPGRARSQRTRAQLGPILLGVKKKEGSLKKAGIPPENKKRMINEEEGTRLEHRKSERPPDGDSGEEGTLERRGLSSLRTRFLA